MTKAHVYATLPVADPRALAEATAWGFALPRSAPSSLWWLGLPCGVVDTSSPPGVDFAPSPHGTAAHEVASALGRMAPGWWEALQQDGFRRQWEFAQTRASTLFVLADDAPGVYHRVAAPYDAAMAHFLRHTYGARLVRLVNETLSPEPTAAPRAVRRISDDATPELGETWLPYP